MDMDYLIQTLWRTVPGEVNLDGPCSCIKDSLRV